MVTDNPYLLKGCSLKKLTAQAFYKDLSALTLIFAVVFGWFLAATNYLPYVFDNNESFSAFIHGKNLFDFGLSKSFGLTDEAYGPGAAAHPYVYTHQGNFPRIPAYLMYLAGLQSVESQIFFSTFTIGLGTILLIYSFFSQLSGRLFGLIVAIVFMTDYVLSAQWLVNSFKVWHGFLLFAMLTSLLQFRSSLNSRWLVVLAVLSACIAYFDLLMAVFTYTFCGIFTLTQFPRQKWRALLSVFGALALGGLLSTALFLTQLVCYYGLDGLRQDVYLTFVGRNYAATSAAAAADWQQFFLNKKIVFWEAFADSAPYANLPSAIKTVFQYGFAVFTPYFSFLVAVIALGHLVLKLVRRPGLMALLIAGASTLLYGRYGALLACIPAGITLARYSPMMFQQKTVRIACMFSFCLGANALLAAICFTDALFGQHNPAVLLSVRGISSIEPIFFFAYLLLAAAIFTWLSHRPLLEKSFLQPERLLAAGGFMVILTALLMGQRDLYVTSDPSLPIIWEYILNFWKPHGAAKAFAALTIFIVVYYMLTHSAKEKTNVAQPPRLSAYFAAGVSAYLVAYFFSPGYMVMINLHHFTPVLLFLILPTVALAVAFLVRNVVESRHHLLIGAVGALCLIHIIIFWIGLQKNYVDLIPPDGGQVFKKLDRAPYANQTFVVNSYGAPVAAKTGNWAYIDQKFMASGDYVLTDEGYRPVGNNVYKWFANRDDVKYFFPTFAFCHTSQFFGNAARAISIRKENPELGLSVRDIYRPNPGPLLDDIIKRYPFGCDNLLFPLHAFADKMNIGKKLLERDPSPLNRWSIYKLEEDFPPYLARKGPDSADRISVELRHNGSHCIALVQYDFRQQQGKAESGTAMRAVISRGSQELNSKSSEIYAGPPIAEIPIPKQYAGNSGEVVVSITPSTSTKKGATFTSNAKALSQCKR